MTGSWRTRFKRCFARCRVRKSASRAFAALCRSAGVPSYNYFHDKTDLVEWMVRQAFEEQVLPQLRGGGMETAPAGLTRDLARMMENPVSYVRDYFLP
uniref:Uncharacterized protein n=1 Tax=termite gut metagenome TaxID=433724 RepID=S0DED6_9ZZZZ